MACNSFVAAASRKLSSDAENALNHMDTHPERHNRVNGSNHALHRNGSSLTSRGKDFG